MQCEQYIVVSWYQKRCERPAKYRVTRQHLFQNGTKSTTTLNLCSVCSRREREYRYKLDNHLYYNDADLDHTYPTIQPLEEVKIK